MQIICSPRISFFFSSDYFTMTVIFQCRLLGFLLRQSVLFRTVLFVLFTGPHQSCHTFFLKCLILIVCCERFPIQSKSALSFAMSIAVLKYVSASVLFNSSFASTSQLKSRPCRAMWQLVILLTVNVTFTLLIMNTLTCRGRVINYADPSASFSSNSSGFFFITL